MKRSVSLLGILCLFVSFSVQAQYTNIQTWGQKLYYNGSDYPGTFLKLKVAVAILVSQEQEERSFSMIQKAPSIII